MPWQWYTTVWQQNTMRWQWSTMGSNCDTMQWPGNAIVFTKHCQWVPTHFHGITRLHWLLLCQVYENKVTFSPHSFHINSPLQLILRSFFQNCGQCWSPGCDKDACDSYHKATKLTEKEMIEFLLDNYLERNYNKLLKICSPKLPLTFLYHKINTEHFLYLLINSLRKNCESFFAPGCLVSICYNSKW